MTAFSELTGRRKAIELLRWLCVLPAAVLGGLATCYIGGLLSRFFMSIWGTSVDSTFVSFFRLVLLNVPKSAAFVVADGPVAVPTLELTVHVRAPLPLARDWVLGRYATRLARDKPQVGDHRGRRRRLGRAGHPGVQQAGADRYAHADRDAVPIARNPMPSPNEGRIVRGKEARFARLTEGLVELPKQPKSA